MLKNILFLIFCLYQSLNAFDEDFDKEKAYLFLYKEIIKEKYGCLCSKNKEFFPPFFEIPAETFSSMVILDLLVDKEFDEGIIFYLIQKIISEQGLKGLYCFFKDSHLLPPDVDCTALAYTVLLRSNAIASDFVDNPLKILLSNVNKEGLIEVYVDPKRSNRVDAVVSANILYLAYLCKKNEAIQATEDFIYQTLKNKSYKNGSRYYPSKFTFLYMISRLLDFPILERKFSSLLHRNLMEEINTDKTPLELAMWIICAKKLGLDCFKQKKKLIALQLEDGGWAACTFYKKGRSSEFFGSRSITTAFAIHALHANEEIELLHVTHGE